MNSVHPRPHLSPYICLKTVIKSNVFIEDKIHSTGVFLWSFAVLENKNCDLKFQN